MTLVDFFTLTEMKEGLIAPGRVKELINVLQKDKHNAMKNVGDSTREWCTVASTIAATENKDCLALFLQLDGLCYFDTWLKHCQKCFQETGDSFIEEAMIVLLGEIEKLHIDEQKSVISGIMVTVKDLLSSKSSRVQDRARALFDIWMQNNESNVVHKDDVDKEEGVCDNLVDVNAIPASKHKQPECSSQDISTSRGINTEEKNLGPAPDEMTPALSPETMQTEVVVDLVIPTSDKTFGHASIHDGSPDPVHSDTLNLVSENSSVLRNSLTHQLEVTTEIKSSGSAVLGQRMLEEMLDVSNSCEHDEAKQMPQIRRCNSLGATDTSFCVDTTNTVESKVGFCVDTTNTVESKVGDNDGKDDVEKEDPCRNNNSSGDVKKEVSEGKDEMCDGRSPNICSKISAFDSTAPADVLQGSSWNEHNMEEDEDLTTNLSREVDAEAIKKSNVSDEDEVDRGNEDLTKILSIKEVAEAIEESNGKTVSDEDDVDCGNKYLSTNLSRKDDIEAIKESNGQNVSDENDIITSNLSRKEDTEAIEESNSQNVSDEDEVVWRNDPDFSMSEADEKHSDPKKSGFQLDYDMFDPLEVARQVAIEVEREVDCREPSCSSSERTSGDGKRLPESPDSIKGKNSRVIHRPFKDVLNASNLSAVVGDEAFFKAKNLPTERGNCIVDIEPTGISEVAQKKEPDADNYVCGFDLNEDVLSDIDIDKQINPVTSPILVVSASRDAATSGLPPSPLQSEGTLGWKGSAEGSAFRPASTCKISEGENSIFAPGSRSNLFRRQEYLDFDLNIAEGEDNITDLLPSKEIPNLSSRPSGNFSLEASQKRSDLLQLDLNCVSDSGDAPLSYWRKEERVLPHFNGQLGPSASSSSSSLQPSLKTIDLNDQPSPFTEFLPPALTVKSSTDLYTSGTGGFKTDESVISLMGAKVEVSRKDNVARTIPLLNGRIVDPALDASMTRNNSVMGLASSSLYAHSYMYGYNDPSSGPTVPYSSAIYGLGGQFPYMVDSRGTPVVPQVLGPVQPHPPPFPQQPSFFESLAAAPGYSNGFVPSRNSFDLNSGLMIEGRSRDAGNLTLFNHGQGISMDEQMRANSQSTSSSGVGGKRKETDGGWDPNPFNFKHHQPPWK